MLRPQVAVQPADKRVKNFNEVSFGFSKKIASEEARRCPQCAEAPCRQACPLGVDIPSFIRQLREGNVTDAYNKIKERNCFASICGRICSAPCEEACILNKEEAPIPIRLLERYVADFGKSLFSKKSRSPLTGKRIAVVGAGPCGLSAAHELVQKGYQATVFETFNKPGGVLRYGVPDFRIPKKVLDGEINEIKSCGVVIETNVFVGQTILLEELLADGFDAVLIATGAGVPKFMDLPGANLCGVYYGEEFLMRVNLTRANIFSRHVPAFVVGEKIAVVGSGNTALDCARAAVRFGRDVKLIFRRTEEEMRVRVDEREWGKEEGIQMEPMVRPVEILAGANNRVKGLKCIRMDYADKDLSGQWELVPVPDSEFVMNVDTVIIAIGHKPNISVQQTTDGLQTKKEGMIKINEQTQMTSLPGVFSAGNVVTNAGPVINALSAGKRVAEQIDIYLNEGSLV